MNLVIFKKCSELFFFFISAQVWLLPEEMDFKRRPFLFVFVNDAMFRLKKNSKNREETYPQQFLKTTVCNILMTNAKESKSQNFVLRAMKTRDNGL